MYVYHLDRRGQSVGIPESYLSFGQQVINVGFLLNVYVVVVCGGGIPESFRHQVIHNEVRLSWLIES